MSNPTTLISTQLTTTKGLTPSEAWLTTFLTTQRPTTPLPALTSTACFRLLASDITTSLSQSPTTCFPPDVHNANIKERKVAGPIALQVLAVEDMSKSRWEQIEAIEALERGEGTKGREIIRVTATEEGDEERGGAVAKIGGPHKLALQDAIGSRVYGIELKGVEGVGVGMSMGCKMVLRNVVVARGMVLLEPGTVTVLGGKIEGLHKAWKEGRKAELRAAIEASERGG
ncbi:hypothetical protein N7G274_002190 [Stereocaulon virgatum]|uniref:RecQ-mediated genome instability protein 1 n=1 Tax=Stereocaulon virgatum TaxID=373712 RepID=A0ABR4AJT9_9LECA